MIFFQVLYCTNDNTYKINLSGEYGISITFNVIDLTFSDTGPDLLINPFEEGEDDISVDMDHERDN